MANGGSFGFRDPTAPDPAALKGALQGAGILGASTSDLAARVSAELAKQGVKPTGELVILYNSNHYCLIVASD